MNEQNLPIGTIRIDGGTQPRESLNEEVIAQYAAEMSQGAEFPPVTVFQDGAERWLADGFHRYHAARKAGLAALAAEVRPGTRRDAILFSVGANAAHGLRRTNADKRKAILTLLKDGEWKQLADREIARLCQVDHKTVAALRGSLGKFPSEQSPNGNDQRRAYTTKHGTSAVMNTSNIGRANATRAHTEPPRISPKAYMPVRGHSNLPPMTALNMPQDAEMGARTLIELFTTNYLRALVAHLTEHLKGIPQ